jgi:hypothetical protein
MDDTHQGGSIHLGVTVFSAALAAAELAGASGERVLRAAVAGYEVAARLAMALDPAAHYARGFHPTGTCGAFGAAAAAAVVLGLDTPAVATALGIAGSQASGSMEFLADGAWTKRLHPGWAACAGLHAAALARAGFKAPTSVLEGRFGFLHAYSDRGDAAPILARDGYELLRTSVKPHACCRYMQGPIDAALALRAEHRIDPATVERIEVGMPAGFAIVRAGRGEATPRLHGGQAVQPPLRRRGRARARHRLAGRLRTGNVRRPGRARADGPRALRATRGSTRPSRAWPCWLRIVRRGEAPLEARVEHPRAIRKTSPTRPELRDAVPDARRATLAPPAIARLEGLIAEFPHATSALRASATVT